VGGGPSSGTVDLQVGVTAPSGAQDLAIRVLDASRQEWAGSSGPTRRPCGFRSKSSASTNPVEATATRRTDGPTETVVRVPFGVPDPIVDDGTFATFTMEPGR